MRIEDEAIILSSRKFNERDSIVTVFGRDHGILSGVVRAGQGKAKNPICQPANLVEVKWNARLEEQLGTLYIEMIDAISSKLLSDRAKLQASLSVTSLIKTSMADRDPHPKLYDVVKTFLLDVSRETLWVEEYVKFEIELLRECGFGLDFSKCAATGLVENLKYISPKTGRAVSEDGAVGYEDRLFKIPAHDDYSAWLKITGHFLNTHAYAHNKKGAPEERDALIKTLTKRQLVNIN